MLSLREPPATELSQRRRVDDLALRMIYGWEAGASELAISKPWTPAADRDPMLLPDPLLGVFSEVAHRLAGRRALGRLPLGDGLEAIIFDGPGPLASPDGGAEEGGGMIAAWNRFAPPDEAVLHMYLGPAPTVTDVWGNRRGLPITDGKHRVPLSAAPLFIEGIDARLALFRASFRLDPPFIESTQAPHVRALTFTNPWPRTISGTVLVREPASWRVSPRRVPFSVAAGQTTSIPIELAFPVSEVAGTKTLVARFSFTAEREYKIDLTAPMKLGLHGIDFDANLTVTKAPAGADAVVTMLIGNTGPEPVALHAFANLPGYPRQERLIPRLEPGESVVRQFRFAHAADLLKDQNVRVGLRETNGPAVLNQVLSVDPR